MKLDPSPLRSPQLLEVVLIIAAAARPLLGWLIWRAAMQPDASFYAAGGLGLFPSPLGRAIGAGGLWSLALVNVVANGAVAWLIAELAGRRRANRLAALGAWLLVPESWWMLQASVDAAGVALLLLGVKLGRTRGRMANVAAMLVHTSTIPVVIAAELLGVGSRLLRAAIVTGALASGILLLSFTDYNLRGHVDVWDAAFLTAWTLVVSLVPIFIALPWIVVSAYRKLVLAWTLGGLALAGVVSAATTNDPQPRYLIPALALGCSAFGSAVFARRAGIRERVDEPGIAAQ